MAPPYRGQGAEAMERVWLRWARCAAAVTGLLALLALIRGASPGAADGVVAAAAAILLLSPVGVRSRWARALGRLTAIALTAGALTFWLPGLQHLRLRPPVSTAALCFLLLGVSLLIKPRWPAWAASADVLTGFLGTATFMLLLFNRGAPSGQPTVTPLMPAPLALAVLVLAGAWMASQPRLRPASFFLETGSAGAVMRRLLPLTLLFPVLLAALAALRAHDYNTAARLAQMALVAGAVLAGAALLWYIASLLDRRDALSAAADSDLRVSEERYRLLFEHNPQPMWIFDGATYRILAVNASALAKFGYVRDEFLGKSILDLRPPEEADLVRRELESGGDGRGRIWQYRTRSGRPMLAKVVVHSAHWRGHTARLTMMQDVTDHLAAESQVQALLESTTEGIFASDAQGNCIWCNGAAARLLGFDSPAQLLGKNTHAVAHHTRADGTPYPEQECAMRRATEAGETGIGDEDLLWRADGTSFYADWRSSPLRGAAGASGAVVTFRDVTERRNLRQQFQQAQKMEAVGRLAAGIAHDFNNLLTVINGYTELLLARPASGAPEDAEARARVAGIRKAGERAAGLTKQLLAFSRQQVLEPRVLDLNAVVAEMEPLLRRVLGEDVEIKIACADALGTVRADPGQIGQVLMNLVVNARDAMPQGGTLTLETANAVLDQRYAADHPDVVPGDYVMLAVRDTGTGMDAATRSHIFEPFFTTKPVGQGTGLGLATVFGIAKQSGGHVGVSSELGVGTTMQLYLPRLAVPAQPSPVTELRPSAHANATVLVVEDEGTVRGLMEEILRVHGYDVLAASQPDDALRLAREHTGRIDLLLCDVIMPGMGGPQLAQAVKVSRPCLRVLFVSGHPDPAVARTGALDADATFLQKPFTPESLAAKVRLALDRPAQAAVAS
jgi:two-component system cell cycle sensor histidine kinase/response regulator CckA